MDILERVQQRVMKIIKEVEYLSHKETLFRLGKRKIKGNIIITLQEMAQAAAAKGLKLLGITEH